MITVISGTNRKGANTHSIATYVYDKIKLNDSTVKLLSLEDLPKGILSNDMFEGEAAMSDELKSIQDEFILSADKYIFLAPEYNGSIPGVLKLFIDAISIREFRGGISHKKAGLIGVASGRAGNLRGLDHLSGILEYCMTTVYPDKLPISGVHNLVKDRTLIDESTKEVLDQWIEEFVKY